MLRLPAVNVRPIVCRYGLSSVGLRAVSYIRCEARAPMRHFRKLTLPAMPHFKESLNEPLKQRVSFNFEFPFENSRDVRVRKKRINATFSKVDTFCNAAFIGKFKRAAETARLV